MRNTNLRWKSNGWAFASIFALVLLFCLFGCDSTGAGGSNGGGDSDSGGTGGSTSPGDALLLLQGGITGWDLGTRDEVVVILVDAGANPVQGYGPVTVQFDGHFPGMSIDPPTSGALLSWEDFQYVYEYSLSSMPVSITDDSVGFQTFCYLDVQYMGYVISRGNDDELAAVSWVYVDGPTNVSGTFNTGDYDVTIDLQLGTGWNRTVFQQDDTAKVITLKTEAEPAGTAWVLE